MKLQLKLSFAIMLFVLTMLLGCSKKTETEAVKHAKEYWKLTQIGGSNYLCETTTATRTSGYGAIASKTVFELRNIKIKVSPSSLNEADKLNGVEWEGKVYLEAEAFRRYSPQPYSGGEPDKTWSDWTSRAEANRGLLSRGAKGYHDALDIRKIKGQWEVNVFPSLMSSFGDIPSNPIFKQVEASDLPK